MSSIAFIIIMIIICFIIEQLFFQYVTHKPDFKFFLFWIAVCIVFYFIFSLGASVYAFLAYCFINGADGEESSHKGCGSTYSTKNSNSIDLHLYDKVYENGTRRVKNLSKTGHYYSDGTESREGMLGEEVRSNGEIVCDNTYISGRRDIYDKTGRYVGYEYEDGLGVTHRVDN